MPNWISITLDNLNNAKVAALVSALNTSALGEEQTDRATEIIADIVATIRNKVAACATNQVDADETTIPKELKPQAVRLILWAMKNALEIEVTEAEKIDHANDLKDLNAVAACQLPVSQPDDAEEPDIQPVTPSPRITAKTLRFTRCDQDGI